MATTGGQPISIRRAQVRGEDGARVIFCLTPKVLFYLLALIVLMVAERRLAGALVEPLSGPALILTSTIAAIAVLSIESWHSWVAGSSARPGYRVGLAICLIVLAAAMSLPGSSVLGLAVLWLISLFIAVWLAGLVPAGPLLRAGLPWTFLDRAIDRESAAAWSDALATNTIARLERIRLAPDREQICGWVRIDFAPGERTGIAHIAFCPPFAKLPEVQLSVGKEARLKRPPRLQVGQVLHQGVRLEVKLAEAVHRPLRLQLNFSARGETNAC